MVQRRVGMSELPQQSFCIAEARVSIVHVTLLCLGGVLWVNVYLHDSEGLSPQSWKLLTMMGGILHRHGMPFTISGDWNLTPEEVRGSGWADTLGAVLLSPTTATCARGAVRTLDWFAVSHGLHYGARVRVLAAVVGGGRGGEMRRGGASEASE
eukprot:7588574-Pyramimonas_sp.AAC.1